MNEKKIIAARKLLIDYLANLAKKKGVSQQWIADASGIPRPHVNRFFSGTTNPTLDTFIKVSDALGVFLFVIDKSDDSDIAESMRKRWTRKGDKN